MPNQDLSKLASCYFFLYRLCILISENLDLQCVEFKFNNKLIKKSATVDSDGQNQKDLINGIMENLISVFRC